MRKLRCILLIDDDPITNYTNRKLLENLHVTDRVRVAQTGQEALDLLLLHGQQARADSPVLLFLDVKMPVMSGPEFLAAFQELPLAQRQAIVIVMLTTSLNPLDVERVAPFAVADFLSKPLTQEKVEYVLRTHFARAALDR